MPAAFSAGAFWSTTGLARGVEDGAGAGRERGGGSVCAPLATVFAGPRGEGARGPLAGDWWKGDDPDRTEMCFCDVQCVVGHRRRAVAGVDSISGNLSSVWCER